MTLIYQVVKDSVKSEYIDDPVLLNAAAMIRKKIVVFHQCEFSGWPIGLEKAVISLLQSGKSTKLNRLKLDRYRDVSTTCPGISNILLRPYSELAAKYIWACPDGAVTFEDIKKLAGIAGASPNPELRQRPCRVFDQTDDWKLFYIDPEILNNLVEEWIVRYNKNEGDIVEELIKILQFLIIHPFMDGNGRLSRLLLQRKLAEHGLLNYPLLPVGPVLRCEMHGFSRSMRDWAIGGSIVPPLRILLEALDDTADLVTELLSGE